jgi:pyrroline-5-carboxylate reductase
MGSALARHLASRCELILCDKNLDKAKTLAQELHCRALALAEAIGQAKVIILAIKPKDLHTFAKSVQLSKDHLLISILGATPLQTLQDLFPKAEVVRALPNLPIQCGKGVVGFAAENEKHRPFVETLFQEIGTLFWLSEGQLEALSALAGSGPAFVLLLIEAMMDSGVFLGFKPKVALELALQVIEGTAALLRATSMHPAELKLQVASPGGTTIAGLKVLEESGIRGELMNAFIATYLKKPLS